jgi:hypothetical protein
MKTVRRKFHRRPRPSDILRKTADSMLDHAERLLATSNGLDTAVRDIVSEGVARIVYAAYDTMSLAVCLDAEQHVDYIQTQVYQWFRTRGFVEWFCAGSSTLFRTTPREFFRTKVSEGKKVVRFKKEKITA